MFTASPNLPSGLTPREFVEKWGPNGPAYGLSERAGAQAHFMDLCQLLGVPTPGDPDRYCFERGLTRTGGGTQRINGFADVWLKGHFAWEYKAPGKSLDGALTQLMRYALPLENPPLLVVSDRLRTEIHTHFTGTPSECHVIFHADIVRPETQELLRRLWTSPDSFKPKRTNREITEEAATAFAGTAERLRNAGVPAAQVSHFLTQCLFCFFAEDVKLLPERLFERLVGVVTAPERMRLQLQNLFATMRDGGMFGAEDLHWFNGGLFETVEVPPLATEDVSALQAASALDWSAVDPSIIGTLFERGLDPGKRSQLGAHYTDPDTIMRLIEPVVIRPFRAEWKVTKDLITQLLAKRDALRIEAAAVPSTTKVLIAKFGRLRTRANEYGREAQAAFGTFLERLRTFRVLDPACGSGNFLYLALKSLKDIEHQANIDAEQLGLERQHDVTGPHNVLGIELNEYAAELARVTVWIGELQWRIQHGLGLKLTPVLEPLDQVECRDAVLDPAGREATWPTANVVVGNPPFVGDKRMRRELGDAYTEALRSAYKGRLPGAADFVCYWFEKARALVASGLAERVGLAATNSIRQSANRTVLHRIKQDSRIFEAWSDLPWINAGASVRVSLVAFGSGADTPTRLDGSEVEEIYADLRGRARGSVPMDLTTAKPLIENRDASFFGFCLSGPFDVDGAVARQWLSQPNPNGRSNADVLAPIWSGKDVTERGQDQWVIDFGCSMTEVEASLYEKPFAHVSQWVLPSRGSNNRGSRVKWWFRHGETRPGLRRAGSGLQRWIVTVERAKHRYFVWLPAGVAPEHRLVAFPRQDDTTFGILSARLHLVWAIALGGTLEDRPGYNTKVCFLTFPFPEGLAPTTTAHRRTETLEDGAQIPADLPEAIRNHATAIARAAKRLVELRNDWLNPAEWTERVAEVVPLGMSSSPYPDRTVPRIGFDEEVSGRTLTNLYNSPPTWLERAHEDLDSAVAAAYGWSDYSPTLSEEEILRRLLALNGTRV